MLTWTVSANHSHQPPPCDTAYPFGGFRNTTAPRSNPGLQDARKKDAALRDFVYSLCATPYRFAAKDLVSSTLDPKQASETMVFEPRCCPYCPQAFQPSPRH